MKKKAVLFISMLALLMSVLSLPVLATQQAAGSTTPAPTVTAPTVPTPSVPTPTAPAPTTPEPTAPAPTAPVVTYNTYTIKLAPTDASVTANMATLSQQFCNQQTPHISTCTSFPVVFDLNSLQNPAINTVIVPNSLLTALCTAHQTAAAAQPTLTQEALKVVTSTYEQVWTVTELQALSNNGADTVPLMLQTAAPTTPADPTTPVQPAPPVEKPRITVEFTLEDGDEEQGVLFVSKNAAGQWQVTDQNLYSSALPYVLIAILLVVIAFVAIVAVNLIIIKVYRAHN